MIRPVMRADLENSWVAVAEQDVVVPHALKVFPNPTTTGFVYVETEQALDWELYDNSGRRVQHGRWPNGGLHQVDVSRAAPGLYMLVTNAGQYTRIVID